MWPGNIAHDIMQNCEKENFSVLFEWIDKVRYRHKLIRARKKNSHHLIIFYSTSQSLSFSSRHVFFNQGVVSREKPKIFTGNTNIFTEESFAILYWSCRYDRLVADTKQYNTRSQPVKDFRVQPMSSQKG